MSERQVVITPQMTQDKLNKMPMSEDEVAEWREWAERVFGAHERS